MAMPRSDENEAAFNAVLAFLQADRWWADAKAGKKALRHHYLARCGFVLMADGVERHWAWDDNETAEVILAATQGDRVAHDVLLEIAHRVTQDEPLPLRLQAYIMGEARCPQEWKTGPHSVDHLYRNEAIYQAILITVRHGFKAMRNDATIDPSGSEIVARALERLGVLRSPRTIEGIYTARHAARAKSPKG